jgi:uncharacterized membrane protein YidH (DUF202 family)
MRMGPGYFPTYIGILLMIMGLVIAVRGILVPEERIGGWGFRPLLVLGAAILAFAYAMDTLGFVPALAIVVIGATFASREFRPIEAILLAATLIVGAVGIFIYGIELPYRLFWWD